LRRRSSAFLLRLAGDAGVVTGRARELDTDLACNPRSATCVVDAASSILE
jgi:hypothetical protein